MDVLSKIKQHFKQNRQEGLTGSVKKSVQSLNNQKKGAFAEEAALDFLRSKGLVLVARNYRTRAGEIDLIMRELDTLVFIEVRLRLPSIYAAAAETIIHRKQARIIKASQHYLQHYVADRAAQVPNCRFDVMASDGKGWQWIQSAFDFNLDS